MQITLTSKFEAGDKVRSTRRGAWRGTVQSVSWHAGMRTFTYQVLYPHKSVAGTDMVSTHTEYEMEAAK